jgi:hypothetical protein
MSKPKVHVIYGFAEGPWHGRRFRRELADQGLKTTDQPEQADIILGHSGGCYLLPPANPDQLVVLINPPYWPGKLLVISALQSLWWNAETYTKENSYTFWAQKTFWNVVYTLAHLRKSIYIAKEAWQHGLQTALRSRRTLIIRSSHDPWLAPNAKQLLQQYADFQYKELKGVHDDCWLHPSPYVEVIKSVYDTGRAH